MAWTACVRLVAINGIAPLLLASDLSIVAHRTGRRFRWYAAPSSVAKNAAGVSSV